MDILHIAKLARIDLDDKEKEKIEKEISSILAYVEKLNELDTVSIEPMSHIVGQKNVIRKDTAEKPDKEITEKILEQVPSKKERYVRTKAIL